MAPKDHLQQRARPFAVYLALSAVLHSVVVLGVIVGIQWWGSPIYDRLGSHTVPLIDAPIAIRLMQAAKASQPPPASAPPTPPKASKAGARKRAKKPQVATAAETRHHIARLRARQAQLAQEQRRAEQAQQEAAAERIAALRLRVNQPTTGATGAAERAARLQHIRLQAYQALVRDKIIAAWTLPLPPAETRNLHSMVFLRVARTGEVTQLKLTQSSGHALFDASFLRAIKRASPLPTLPTDYEGEFLEIELHFHVREGSM